MTSDNKILLAVVAVTVVILLFGIFMLGRTGGVRPAIEDQVVAIDYSKGQKVGSDSAKVRLVEFSDFQCPACRVAFPEVDNLIKSNPDNFQFVYRHFTLPQHKNSKKAAVLAEFAGTQGKFFEMGAKLFETQPEWDELADPSEFFVDLAVELGLDKDAALTALLENQRLEIITADVNEGNQIGVDSTPSFYLDGRRLNLNPGKSLTEVVREELAK